MKTIRRVAKIVAIAILVVLAYPLRSGRSLRDATADEITQQVPYALDMLAARHPLKVGLLRSLLNNNGAIDKLTEDYVRSSMNRQNTGLLDCYVIYYVVAFDQDGIRKDLADGLEKELGLV
jgi:hypothetical protein